MRVNAALLVLSVPALVIHSNAGPDSMYAALAGIISAAPAAALWWWLAVASQDGQRWARTAATVFFGLNTSTETCG
jgi:hypothetical protein